MEQVSVVLHVGLPKTGTTYLQQLLASHRDRLRESGVLYPFVGPGAMFHAAVEIRGSAAKFGLDPAQIAGTWRVLCQQARTFDGTTILGHEVLAGSHPAAGGSRARGAVRPRRARRRDREGPRSPGDGALAGGGQARVHGELRRARAGPTARRHGSGPGAGRGGQRPHFWHAQDFADCLHRWSTGLPPRSGHLVVCPAPGASPDVLWRRFSEAAGIDPSLVEPGPVPANRSLASTDVALLRSVNELLGDQITVVDRLRLLKRGWAETELAHRPGVRPQAPADLHQVLGSATEAFVDRVRRAGHVVHGDLDDLTPVLAAPGEPPPDSAPRPGEDPRELARDFVAAASRPADPGAGPSGGLRRWAGWMRSRPR